MSDAWAAWNQKKPKDSKYDSGAWSKTEEDYESVEKAVTDEEEEKKKKPGFFSKLKKAFSES